MILKKSEKNIILAIRYFYSDIYKNKEALYTMLMTAGYLKVAELRQ